jgi:hypothetical protein
VRTFLFGNIQACRSVSCGQQTKQIFQATLIAFSFACHCIPEKLRAHFASFGEIEDAVRRTGRPWSLTAALRGLLPSANLLSS